MSSEKVLKRDEIQEQYKWKLEHLFQTDELWEKTYNEISSKIPKLGEFEGRISQNGQNLLECLETSDEISTVLDKLYVYSNMRLHQDSTNSFYQSQSNKAEMLVVKYMSYTAFIVPEITNIPTDMIEKFKS